MKRTPLKAVGRRALREKPEVEHFRMDLKSRSRGLCERCGQLPVLMECHHIVNRARAIGWPKMHDADVNGLALCHPCHDRLTRYPRDEGGHLEGRITCAFLSFESWRVWDRQPAWN